MTTPRGPDRAEAPLVVPDRVVGWFETKAPALTVEDRVAASARRGACVALVIAAIAIVLAIATLW